MELRLATMEDFELFNSMYTRFVEDTELEPMSKEMQRGYLDIEAIYFAVEQDVVVGYAIAFAYHDKTAAISQFYVTEKRKGYGRKFYKLLEIEIRECNMESVSLYCLWEEAERFWTKMGYKSVNGTEKFSKKLN